MLSGNVALTAVVYAVLALCHFKVFVWSVLPVVLVAIFGRWAFHIHTRTHYRGRYPWFEDWMLLVMSPFSVGLQEQRSVHLRHHKFLGHPADPDWLFYSVNPLTAAFRCCLHPEITFWREARSMNRRSRLGAAVRFLLFVAGAVIGGVNFWLWYLLPLRLLFAGSQFVFTWLLHHRPHDRTINLYLPPCSTILLGKVGWRELRTHFAHHQ